MIRTPALIGTVLEAFGQRFDALLSSTDWTRNIGGDSDEPESPSGESHS